MFAWCHRGHSSTQCSLDIVYWGDQRAVHLALFVHLCQRVIPLRGLPLHGPCRVFVCLRCQVKIRVL